MIDSEIGDFYCHAENSFLEVDGWGRIDERDHDFERNENLQRLGPRVLRFNSLEFGLILTSFWQKIKTRQKL